MPVRPFPHFAREGGLLRSVLQAQPHGHHGAAAGQPGRNRPGSLVCATQPARTTLCARSWNVASQPDEDADLGSPRNRMMHQRWRGQRVRWPAFAGVDSLLATAGNAAREISLPDLGKRRWRLSAAFLRQKGL